MTSGSCCFDVKTKFSITELLLLVAKPRAMPELYLSINEEKSLYARFVVVDEPDEKSKTLNCPLESEPEIFSKFQCNAKVL